MRSPYIIYLLCAIEAGNPDVEERLRSMEQLIHALTQKIDTLVVTKSGGREEQRGRGEGKEGKGEGKEGEGKGEAVEEAKGEGGSSSLR